MTKISKTPWKLHDGGTSVIDSNNDNVASCGFIPYKSIFEERANAKLISVAPKLADTLADLVLMIEQKNNGDFSGNVPIRDAICLLNEINWQMK